MPKNAHIHIVVESDYLEYMKREAKKRMLSLSEFCRIKLQNSFQLERIESKLDKVLNGTK